MEITTTQISNTMKKTQNFSILTHEFPDGDTLGSAFALFYALKLLKKNAKVICDQKIHPKYDFLYNLDEIECRQGPDGEFFYTDQKADIILEKEYVIAVDVAEPRLLGRNLMRYHNKIDLCIDHHGTNRGYANLNHIDTTAAATAEVIFDLLNLLKVDFNNKITNCIYTGILTDTGGFKHTNTTPKTHKIAAKMLEFGAKYNFINRKMFEEKTKERMVLERLVLESIEFFENDQIAMIFIKKSMIKTAGVKDDDTDGFASIPRSIKGVLIGITAREKENGEFKISIRSSKNIDSAKICQNFGGGGHTCAAGFSILGNIENLKQKIIDECAGAIKSNEQH